MHDILLFPERSCRRTSKPNVDLGNVPRTHSLEVTGMYPRFNFCIGPSKEMSRHYWREPLVAEAVHDEDIGRSRRYLC